MNPQDLIKEIAQSAGVESFEFGEDNTIPEEVVSAIKSNLITPDSAKNNPDVAKHFKGQYLGTVNRELEKFLKDTGIDEGKVGELNNEPDTLKRLRAGMSVYAEHLKNTPDKKVSEKEKELAEKLNSLQAQLSETQSTWQQKLSAKEQEFENERVNFAVNSKLNSYQFSEAYPVEDVKLLIGSKLNNSPYVFKRNGDKVGVFQKDNPELEAYDGTKKLELDDVLNKFVEPYLKKSNPTEKKDKFVHDTRKKPTFTFGGHAQPQR